MNNTFKHTNEFKSYVLLYIFLFVIILTVLKCLEPTPEPTLGMSVLPLISKPTNQSIPMAGDTVYIPVAWGAELRVVPNVIFSGRHRKYGPYWFTKTMSYQLVKPANYQQDSLRERVAFADSVQITNADTFYICRKKIL